MGNLTEEALHHGFQYTGGKLECDLVEEFSTYANTMEVRWPRTAAIPRRLARTFQNMAISEDNQAELKQDLNF